jgi:hypothetical protein
MSFPNAEATDASLSGLAALLRNALEQPKYARNIHQVYDNMDSDPLIGPLREPGRPASRFQLLQHVSGHRSNPSVIADEVVLFCRANMQQGPLLGAEDTITYGRVQGMRSLVNAVAGAASSVSQRNAEALMYDIVAVVAEPSTKLAIQQAELTGKTLSLYQMWSYPAADPQNPYREIGTAKMDAVNILGLGYYAHEKPDAEIVRWAHHVPSPIRVHQPTAWDGGTDKGNVYWRPGGRTYRLDCDEFGVTEVVHDPIKGQDLVMPIEMIS